MSLGQEASSEPSRICRMKPGSRMAVCTGRTIDPPFFIRAHFWLSWSTPAGFVNMAWQRTSPFPSRPIDWGFGLYWVGLLSAIHRPLTCRSPVWTPPARSRLGAAHFISDWAWPLPPRCSRFGQDCRLSTEPSCGQPLPFWGAPSPSEWRADSPAPLSFQGAS